MKSLRRLAARLVGVMLVTLALALPVATTTDAHATSHMTSPVDATQHHHHDDTGAVVADLDHDEQAPSEDGTDGGHAHMPPHLHGFEAPLTDQPVFAMARVASVPADPVQDRAPPELSPDPDARPPRFV